MTVPPRLFREWLPQALSAFAVEPEAFLRALAQPSWFRVNGRDRSRCRAVVTLLHGNEPSGTLALMRWLREEHRPAVDIVGCFVSIDAALSPPLFSHRTAPGERDQNRCFTGSPLDRPGRVAAELLSLLAQANPECVIDLHNTSGAGPAYGVATLDTPHTRVLTSLFSQHLIHTGLRLGTLIEALAARTPCVTIECGGARQERSHQIAYEGLCRFVDAGDVWTEDSAVEVHHHPVRVELNPGCRVAYAPAPVSGVDVTLRPDVDAHNFKPFVPGESLAWLGPRGLAALRVRGEDAGDRTHEFFEQRGDVLCARIPFRPLMVTTDASIAASDCLFYVVRLDEEHRP